MKWLKIASLVLIGLVLAIFALMGLLFATKGTPTHSVRAFGDPAGPPAASDSVFTESLQLLTHTDVRGGHVVHLFFNGDQTYPHFYADLRSANKSLELQFYYCQPGAIADSLKNILIERASKGVRVLLLLDAFGANLSDEYTNSLRAAGVRVAKFRPVKWNSLHKANNRSHARVVVVDDIVAYTGGFGIADYWLGDGHSKDHWRDTNVRFTGPAVTQMQAAFAIAWAEATGELLTGRAFFRAAAEHPDTPIHAGLLFSTSTLGSTAAERYLALLIAGSRKSLYIANSYFVPDADLRRMLVAAAKRGVDVRILTAGPETDVRTTRHAGHAIYEELLRGGVRIFEYQPVMMHAKTISVDGIWTSIGSMNFDNRSIAFNDEINLTIRDSTVASWHNAQFLDDLHHSNEFKADLFSQRSLKEKVIDFAASRIAKLL